MVFGATMRLTLVMLCLVYGCIVKAQTSFSLTPLVEYYSLSSDYEGLDGRSLEMLSIAGDLNAYKQLNFHFEGGYSVPLALVSDADKELKYWNVGLGFGFYIFPTKRFQIPIHGGVVVGGFSENDRPEMNLGHTDIYIRPGVRFYVTDGFALTGGARYSWGGINAIDGEDLDDIISTNFASFWAGLSFVF